MGFNRRLNHFLVLLPFGKDTVMMNEFFAGLSKEYLVAKLDGLAGLAPYEQFRVFFKKAVYLFIGGRHNTLKNSFVGLITDLVHDGKIMAQPLGFIAGFAQSAQRLASNADNPCYTDDQISIGAFDAALHALFGTGTVAGNEIVQFLDFIIMKAVFEGQLGEFLLNLPEYTGQRAKAVPQQR